MVEERNRLIQLSIMIVMTALVAVATLLIRIPNPMGGYFNVGDAMIFISALAFGPVVGGVAGGVGSAIADIIGFPIFAIPTLIVKGLEGLIAGYVAERKTSTHDILAVILGGLEMVTGYFLVESIALQWGVAAALAEVPANIVQILVGGLVGIPISSVLRRRLSEILTHKRVSDRGEGGNSGSEEETNINS